MDACHQPRPAPPGFSPSSSDASGSLPSPPPTPPLLRLPRYLPPCPSHIRPVKVQDLDLADVAEDLRDVPDLFLRDMLAYLAPRLLAGVDALTILPPSQAAFPSSSSPFPSPLPPILPCLFSPASSPPSTELDGPPIPPTHLLALTFLPSAPSPPSAALERVLLPIHCLPWALTSGVVARALAACQYRACSSPVEDEDVEEEGAVVAHPPPIGSIFASPAASTTATKGQADDPSPFAYNAPSSAHAAAPSTAAPALPPPPPSGSIWSSTARPAMPFLARATAVAAAADAPTVPPAGSIFSSAPASFVSLLRPTDTSPFPSPSTTENDNDNDRLTVSQVRAALSTTSFMRAQPAVPAGFQSPPDATTAREAQAQWGFLPQPSLPASFLPPPAALPPAPPASFSPPSRQHRQILHLPTVQLPLVLPSRAAFIECLARGWVYGGEGAEGEVWGWLLDRAEAAGEEEGGGERDRVRRVVDVWKTLVALEVADHAEGEEEAGEEGMGEGTGTGELWDVVRAAWGEVVRGITGEGGSEMSDEDGDGSEWESGEEAEMDGLEGMEE
ncbi:hypothetical protein JCM6882_002215 [Rhodosporidiobolus microsporus]